MGWKRLTLMMGASALLLAACGKADTTTEPAKPAFHPSAVAPPRKPGLWEQRISNGEAAQVSRLCLDPATDGRVSWWGTPMSGTLCQKNIATARTDGGWQISTVCDMGSGGKVTTSGVARGDFSAHYQVEAESSTVGAAAPQMNGLRKMTVDATWQGPCPADMKPGQMSLPGGVTIDLLDLS